MGEAKSFPKAAKLRFNVWSEDGAQPFLQNIIEFEFSKKEYIFSPLFVKFFLRMRESPANPSENRSSASQLLGRRCSPIISLQARVPVLPEVYAYVMMPKHHKS